MARLRTPRVAAWMALLACAALVAGCGPSAEEQFRKNDLKPLRTKLDQDKTALAGVLQQVRLHNKKSEQAVNAAIDVIAGTSAKIAALKPPGSAKNQMAAYNKANRDLIRALRQFATDLGAGKRKALNADGVTARDAAGEVRRADDALQAVLTKK